MKDIGLVEYYDLRTSTKIKKYLENSMNQLWSLRYIYLFFGIAIMIFAFVYQTKITKLQNKLESAESLNIILAMDYLHLEDTLKREVKKREVDVLLINQKVDALHNFLSRMYPGYMYKSKVDDALYNSEKIQDLPESLLSIVVEKKYLIPHGVKKYNKVLPDIAWPMNPENTFVATKKSEYGAYRPYRLFNYKHEGLDMNNFYDDSVYSVYDGVIYDKSYSEAGGWSLSMKFKYIDAEGNKKWYYTKYLHLEKIFVKKGDIVKKGQLVASMGNTGYFSLGKHLHFELWEWDGTRYKNINPVLNGSWENKYIDKL
jgi:hypothetical protein